jgi:8-oxo-dGTP pyrophosphatase MutT (NUDIX family)
MTQPQTRIRPASTILLLRDGAGGLEVFMVRRHHAIDFASGAMVFPGGSVHAGDADPALDDLCRGDGGLPAASRPFAVAALREGFEECGVLLAREAGAESLLSGARVQALDAQRARLERDEIAMADFLVRERLELALDLLVPFARWVTPAVMPKRFDTWFFLAAAPAGQLARHDGGEAVDSLWLRPAEALAEAEAKRITLVFATRMNLAKLARSNSVVAAIAAARARPVVTVEPEVDHAAPGGGVLRIPAEADYGLTEWPLARIAG